MLVWCLGGGVGVALVPGTRTDRIICLAAIATFLGSYALRRDAESAAERVRLMLPVAVVQTVAAMAGWVGLGLGSPFNGVLGIGVVLYGLSAPRRHSVLVFCVLAGSYAVLTGLVLAGALTGTGILAPAPLPVGTTIANAVWVEATLATGLLVGLFARRDNKRLAVQLEGAVRESAHREALLREAQAELARVVKIGARGPFTGLELGGFRLGNVIGRGGMGEVYAATAAASGDSIEAAVKLLRRDLLAQEDIVRRFERESHIVASLLSPHVVRVLAVGGAEAPLPFIAMERLRGEDLGTILRAGAKLGVEEVFELVHHVCDGLRVAHAAGVVHRDLKPANLYRTVATEGAAAGESDARWVILDFGVSKLLVGVGVSDEGTLTTNEVLGTPHYMAPEQASGKQGVDARADLYSVGVIAYRALTGQLAFARNDVSEVVQAVARDMPDDPRALCKDLPEDVALWLRIAIAKKPGDRFANAQQMADAFADAMLGKMDASLRKRAGALLAELGWGARGA
jgi:serine/threonine-protein kinase